MSKRSRAYKALGLAGQELSDEELLDLMIEEPTLLRRPLIVTDEGSVVGYNQRALQELTEAENA